MLHIICEEPGCKAIILKWIYGGTTKTPPVIDLFRSHFCNLHTLINNKALSKAESWKKKEIDRVEKEFKEQVNSIKQQLIEEIKQ